MIDTLLQKVVSIKDYDITIVELPFRDTVHLPFGNIKTRPSAWLKIKAEIDGVMSYGAAVDISIYGSVSGKSHDITEKL